MNRIDIKNNKNMLVGWVNDIGDCIQGFHLRKGYVGRYVKSSDLTFDKNGRIYCYGNGVSDLVREADRS